MSDYVPDTRSALPATLPTRLSPPRPKKRRRELSNAQRAEIRHHFYHSLSPKPTQKELILCNHNLARLCGAAEGGLSRTSSTTGVLRERHEGPAGDKMYANYAGALLDRQIALNDISYCLLRRNHVNSDTRIYSVYSITVL